MLSEDRRLLYFIFLCIPLRLYLSILPTKIDSKQYKQFALILLLIGISFGYLYFKKKRMEAPEGGGITWWHNQRIIHSINYILSAYYLYNSKIEDSSDILKFDVVVGIIVWSLYRK